MSIIGINRETYLYVNGITPRRELHLAEKVVLLPVYKALPLNSVSNLLKSDVDFAIFVICNQGITSQLKITAEDPKSLAIAGWNSQWDCILLGALFNCDVMCNIQCDKSIEAVDATAHMNITNYAMHALFSESYYLTEDDEMWITNNYSAARTLLNNDRYSTAIHSMATYHWHTTPRVRLAIIWAGIEALFDLSTELSFRISLYAAKFLSDKDNEYAKELFGNIKKLYSARSAAVHGGKIKGDENELVKHSAELLNRLIIKCTEKNALPDMNALLFGC